MPAVCHHLIQRWGLPVTVVVAKDQNQMNRWAEEIAFFNSLVPDATPCEVKTLPDLPDTEETDNPRGFDLECDRLAALTRLNYFRENQHCGEPLVIVTTPRGLFHPTPPREILAAREIRLQAGQSIGFQSLIRRLTDDLSYDSEALCETPGQCAVRGGLVDVYPVNATQPYRIDFFGDEVDEIRAFDPTTQRSLEKVSQLVITALPARTMQLREHHLFDYLGERMQWIFWEPGSLAKSYPAIFTYPEGIPSAVPSLRDLFDRREEIPDTWIAVTDLDVGDPAFGNDLESSALDTEPLSHYRGFTPETVLGLDRVNAEEQARQQFLKELLNWQSNGAGVVCVTHNEGEEARLKEILGGHEALQALAPRFVRGALREGFRISLGIDDASARIGWPVRPEEDSLIVVSDSEIFGRYRSRPVAGTHRRMPRRAQVDQLLDFSELAEGDHLVHLQHGICIYRGLTKMDLHGKPEEVISLEFDESITIHLPLHESHLITRYVGLSKVRPKLGRLGTRSWAKTRRAAEKATVDFAAELLNLQARRNLVTGHAFAPDADWQKEFEQSFIHVETPDQMKAIVEVKEDLELPRAMDRLICGDVGFGKTEVALRAVFKVVMDGKQAAILVPTTVLGQQHYNTFRERMADYPVVVEMISRFRSPSQQTAILAQLKSGAVDIIIGTHRLFSSDVIFKDLGLIVIDEEHRFGVRHKERLKELRENVDVITMSATPIPRTLYLALMGARDLSVIETPPMDRLPIETVVRNYSVELVKDAIVFETSRGGQVFYLHNRVQSIASVARRLSELLPDLRIAIGHGQMDEHQLEDIMTRFVAGEFDILVCTTIIESGLDIPNCNTIIIEGADRFGLSQLYQLRGRVGRFKRQAYAYLLLHRHTHLVDTARKRLAAMKHHNQLGAGFKIAMRDLELRGAGNLLGARQSGHIAGVGFELYCQLLRQSISRLKGTKGADLIRATVRLDFVVVGTGDESIRGAADDGFAVLKAAELEEFQSSSIPAYIPAEYLAETRLRIDFYRRLALADNVDTVSDIREALIDRFGPFPQPVTALLLVTEIRCMAEKKRLLHVESEGNRLKCRRASGTRDDYIKSGNRFPRLTQRDPLKRLHEVRAFLGRLQK